MPLTNKGQKIMSSMKDQYGSEKGKKVFYASRNKGSIDNVDPESSKGVKHKRETVEKPGRSLVDTESFEKKPEMGSVKLYGYLAEPGETCHEAEKNHERLMSWRSRDIQHEGDYKADVVHQGPDTSYKTEEINKEHYGRDYEPAPYKDLRKWEKNWEYGVRQEAQLMYDDCATPGQVPDPDRPFDKHRTFSEQRKSAGIVEIPSEED